MKDPLTRAEYDKTVSGRAHTDLSDDVDSPVDGQHQNREIDEDFTFEGKRHFQFCDEAKQWRRPASSSAQRATSSASAAVPDVPAFASSCGRARNFTTATKFGSAKSFLPQKGTTKSFSSSFASVPDVWTSLSLCDGGSKENVALRSTLRKWKELWRQEIEQEEYEVINQHLGLVP